MLKYGMPLLVAISSVAVASMGLLSGTLPSNRIVVENRAGVAIAAIEVSLEHETHLFRAVEPGQRQQRRFRIESDDHFRVRGQLANGHSFSDEFGYVTHGMVGEQVTVTVLPDGYLEVVQSSDY